MLGFKDNAHYMYLNASMEFNKNGHICCLDITKHDEMKKKKGSPCSLCKYSQLHNHWILLSFSIILTQLEAYIAMDGPLSVLLWSMCISVTGL